MKTSGNISNIAFVKKALQQYCIEPLTIMPLNSTALIVSLPNDKYISNSVG